MFEPYDNGQQRSAAYVWLHHSDLLIESKKIAFHSGWFRIASAATLAQRFAIENDDVAAYIIDQPGVAQTLGDTSDARPIYTEHTSNPLLRQLKPAYITAILQHQ